MPNRQRQSLWRKLAKIKSATNIYKPTKLMQDRWEVETQLRDNFTAFNNLEADKAVFNIKSNPKLFFSFAKSRQKTRARDGPFIDPTTIKPNPSSLFAAEELRKQYNSVFNPPRPEWQVRDIRKHFSVIDDPGALQDIDFTEEDIEKACGKLKSSSAGNLPKAAGQTSVPYMA